MTVASLLIGGEPAFIAVEGLDGVGKSTIVRLVAELTCAEALATPGADLEPVRRSLEPTFDAQYALHEPRPSSRCRLMAA